MNLRQIEPNKFEIIAPISGNTHGTFFLEKGQYTITERLVMKYWPQKWARDCVRCIESQSVTFKVVERWTKKPTEGR